MIAKQLDHIIRMSSYRWAGTKPVVQPGTEANACPNNFTWFLQKIHLQKQIGWLDFIANIGVYCPTSIFINYMAWVASTRDFPLWAG
jgi:hypothetical protein